LGLAAVSIGFGAVELDQLLAFNVRLPQLGENIFIPLVWVPFLSILYWGDASILAARLSDPLLRDTLRWRKVRLAVWAVTLVDVIFLSGASLIPGLLSPQPSSFTVLAFFVFFLPLWLPGICGGVFLPLAARRSGDVRLRRHLEWFGISAAFFLGIAFGAPLTGGEGGTSYLQTLVLLIGFSGGGYALYRGAKSLAPLNRIDLQVGAVLSEVKEKHFQSLGRVVGEQGSEAFAKLAP